MNGSPVTALRTGAQSALMAATVRALPLTQYTPLSKWMAFSLLTVERIDADAL